MINFIWLYGAMSRDTLVNPLPLVLFGLWEWSGAMNYYFMSSWACLLLHAAVVFVVAVVVYDANGKCPFIIPFRFTCSRGFLLRQNQEKKTEKNDFENFLLYHFLFCNKTCEWPSKWRTHRGLQNPRPRPRRNGAIGRS